LLGARTTTPMRLFWTAWLGKSKKDVPPPPWRRMFRPEVLVEFAVVDAPVTLDDTVNWLATWRVRRFCSGLRGCCCVRGGLYW
jgi:hypothetical protein